MSEENIDKEIYDAEMAAEAKIAKLESELAACKNEKGQMYDKTVVWDLKAKLDAALAAKENELDGALKANRDIIGVHDEGLGIVVRQYEEKLVAQAALEEPTIFYMVDGKEYCDNELALSILLKDRVLFANERDYAYDNAIEGSTVVLFVLCNDLFWWATADSENLPWSEIPNLYRMHKADPKWGVAKWCCFRRNLQPQVPAIELMKKAGCWDEKLEALPKPEPS